MKKNLLLRIAVATVLLTTPMAVANNKKAEAAPLKDVAITLKQPNGETIECYSSGDECYNYLHDNNGRAIVKDQKTGYYVYGKYIKEDIIPSRERVTKKSSDGLKKVDNDSRVRTKDVKVSMDAINEKRKMFGVDNSNSQPKSKNKGTLNNIVIFIKFADQQDITRPLSTYNRNFNSKDPNQSSLYNYYKEVSYNQLEINTAFYPRANGDSVVSYTDSHPRSYYSANLSNSERGMREQTLIKNAVDAVKNQIPKGLNIDSDNDGKIDNVCFIVKGAAEGWSSLLWPHKWSMFMKNAEINGKAVDTYNFQLEDFLGDNGTGVLSHEMFHTLGAPDLYHYNYDGKVAVGPWDVMDQTSDIPQSMGAYMKLRYGKWIDGIDEIKKSGTYSIKNIGNKTNNSYIIKSPKSPSEYFVVEYRKQTGIYEQSLPNTGLLVYRINTSFDGTGNASGKDEIYLYREGGNLNDVGSLDIAALNNSSKNKIGGKNNPLFFSNGQDSGISIDNVNVNNDTVRFNVNLGEVKENKILGFKGDADLLNNETIKNVRTINGECVYGKGVKNIGLYVNGTPVQNAKVYAAQELAYKYPEYNLDKAKFTVDFDSSKFTNGYHEIALIATGNDNSKFVIKKSTVKIDNTIIKPDTDKDKKDFISYIWGVKDGQVVNGKLNLVGLALNQTEIYAVDILVDNVPIELAQLTSRDDLKGYYPGYSMKNAQFSDDFDTRRIIDGEHTIQIRAISVDRKAHTVGTFKIKVKNN